MLKSKNMLNYLLADNVFIQGHSNYKDKMIDFLKDIKMMCIQYAVCYKIINDVDEKDDISLIKKLVYSPESDTYYIYVENENFAKYVFDTLVRGCDYEDIMRFMIINGSMQSCDIVYIGEKIYAIELVFNEPSVIERNKLYELKTISI
jgi:hypothetical protein